MVDFDLPRSHSKTRHFNQFINREISSATRLKVRYVIKTGIT